MIDDHSRATLGRSNSTQARVSDLHLLLPTPPHAKGYTNLLSSHPTNLLTQQLFDVPTCLAVLAVFKKDCYCPQFECNRVTWCQYWRKTYYLLLDLIQNPKPSFKLSISYPAFKKIITIASYLFYEQHDLAFLTTHGVKLNQPPHRQSKSYFDFFLPQTIEPPYQPLDQPSF